MKNNQKTAGARSPVTDTTDKLSPEELEAEVKRLWQREAFFDATQSIAQFGYCEWDYDNGRIISCTPAYARIFGMSIEEVIESQNSWNKVLLQIHPEDRSGYEDSYRSQMGQGSHETEYRIFRKDGAIRHVKEIGIVVQDAVGQRKEAVGLIQDVTDYVRMRDDIEKSAAKLKLAARTAKLGYWHFDEATSEYIDISEEYAAIYGYSVQEFLDRFRHLDDDMAVVHPDDREGLYEAYEITEGKVDYTYRMQHRDGHWIHVREISTDISDDNGHCIESIGTLQDVSELAEARQKAEQANRAKTDFLSRMSHELRTPLNAILGYSQLIETDRELDPKQQSKGTAIFRAGQHLLKLIDEMLDLARLEAGDIQVSIESESLEKIIRDCITMISEMAEGRGVVIACAFDELRGIKVEADATRLKQVLLNLLSNAVKYNREQGQVGIDCSRDAPGMISISITDSGYGISRSRMHELFEPFNRLGAELSETEGSGIGLVITRQLVELMQGELEVDSKFGEGSTFTVRLKAAGSDCAGYPNAAGLPYASDHGADDSTTAGPRILIAEDNRVNQELIAEQLDYLGYSADYAASGSEALALWRAGDYQLLLTDISMPGMDGYELIRQIRVLEAGGSRSPIVAVTANAMSADIKRCLDSGADDVLAKPAGLQDLQNTLETWLPRTDADETVLAPATPVRVAAEPGTAIDLSMLRNSVGGRVEVQRRLLEAYIDALPKALFDIRQAFAWHNLDQLGDFAHKLKSSSSSLGATRIAQLCRELESACREGRETDISAIVPQLQQAAEPVADFVKTFCESPATDGLEMPLFQTADDFPASQLEVLLVDDDYIMHRVTSLALNDLGVRRIQSALSGQRALEILQGRAREAQNFDIIICDLNMPQMDGIEFLRHLSRLQFTGSLVLVSGEDIRILRIAEKLAIEHRLEVLGIIEKPVTIPKMCQLLENYNREKDESTIWPKQKLGVDELRNAITAGELETYFQPKVDVATRRVVGVEVLARWTHPTRGAISPGIFIAIAEEHGLISDLTRCVCHKGLEYAATWRRQGIELDLALNISVDALNDLEWPNLLAQQIDDLGLQPAAITLEITESRLMEHIVVALDILGRLSLKRFCLSIDDFGTGYSSMEQLQRIPFSELKIDRAFVRGASEDASARAILESSVQLAKKLDMRVVAEGVETGADWELVAALGCDQVQGYYIARPMPASQLLEWLATQEIGAG